MTSPPPRPSLLHPISPPAGVPGHGKADVLRLDLLHPVISGNKLFKLKYHLQRAAANAGPVITFGGAWSNHLVAAAYAIRQAGLSSIGIVRGEEARSLSATLRSAREYGMRLEFISRRQYAERNTPEFTNWMLARFPGAYIIPEGGSGLAGIRGCEDILRITDCSHYTHVLCAIGTGTMFLGIARASLPGQVVIGVPVLKGVDPLSLVDSNILPSDRREHAQLLTGYHFGGYARHPKPLLDFMNDFYRQTGIPSDIVYTGKLFYAYQDSLKKNIFPAAARILLIHSGGLQGNLSLPPGVLLF
ncbi:MAG TPA: pyridoxal-phosphate dependent enzyme [Puia sp.]|nr:pyridoxal-phosphate dependent enzyme [Puia sp.]